MAERSYKSSARNCVERERNAYKLKEIEREKKILDNMLRGTSTGIHNDCNNFDVYHSLAKKCGLRARSAFKLIQIEKEHNVLQDVTKVVDLCAAPGGWSKVLSAYLFFKETDETKFDDLVKSYYKDRSAYENNNVKIVSVDLMEMQPIPGVLQLVGDIGILATAEKVIEHFKGEMADLVLCDGAVDVPISWYSGPYVHSLLHIAALHITCNVLKPNGTYVLKSFRCKYLTSWIRALKLIFDSVEPCKPDSSRDTSSECFLICRKYNPPEGFDPKLLTPYMDFRYRDFSGLTGINEKIIPALIDNDFSYLYPDEDKELVELLTKHERKLESNLKRYPEKQKYDLGLVGFTKCDLFADLRGPEVEMDEELSDVLNKYVVDSRKEDESVVKCFQNKKLTKSLKKEQLRQAALDREMFQMKISDCPAKVPTPADLEELRIRVKVAINESHTYADFAAFMDLYIQLSTQGKKQLELEAEAMLANGADPLVVQRHRNVRYHQVIDPIEDVVDYPDETEEERRQRRDCAEEEDEG